MTDLQDVCDHGGHVGREHLVVAHEQHGLRANEPDTDINENEP